MAAEVPSPSGRAGRMALESLVAEAVVSKIELAPKGSRSIRRPVTDGVLRLAERRCPRLRAFAVLTRSSGSDAGSTFGFDAVLRGLGL